MNNGEPVYEDGTPLTADENGTTIERYKAEDGTLEYVMTLYKTRSRRESSGADAPCSYGKSWDREENNVYEWNRRNMEL